MNSYSLEELAKHYEQTKSAVHRYVTESDYLKIKNQLSGLEKANSKLSQVENQQGRINQLEAALDCLQFAAYLASGRCENLDRVLNDTLKIHNGAPDEMSVKEI